MMTEPTMLKLEFSQREHHARTYAVSKAADVAAEIVGMVMARTNAEPPDAKNVQTAIGDIQRKLGAFLCQSLLDFSDVRSRDAEDRARALERTLREIVRLYPTVAQEMLQRKGAK